MTARGKQTQNTAEGSKEKLTSGVIIGNGFKWPERIFYRPRLRFAGAGNGIPWDERGMADHKRRQGDSEANLLWRVLRMRWPIGSTIRFLRMGRALPSPS